MRLIDADELKLSHCKECTLYPNKCMGKDCDWESIAHINMMPTVDAVPVIRCKDCKHRDPEDKKCDSGHGIIWQLPRDDDWYCADAERKEE